MSDNRETGYMRLTVSVRTISIRQWRLHLSCGHKRTLVKRMRPKRNTMYLCFDCRREKAFRSPQ